MGERGEQQGELGSGQGRPWVPLKHWQAVQRQVMEMLGGS